MGSVSPDGNKAGTRSRDNSAVTTNAGGLLRDFDNNAKQEDDDWTRTMELLKDGGSVG